MRVHPGNLRITAVAAVAALLLGACTERPERQTVVVGDPATPSESPPPDPLAGAPALRSCFNLSAAQAQALTNTSTPVDCYSEHTTLTYHVGQFEVTSLAPTRSVARRGCQRHVRTQLGLTPRQLRASVLDVVWFQPSTTQWSAGARWYRCDLLARNPQGDGLKPLPDGPSPFTAGLPDGLTRCIRDDDGSAVHVTCDRPHDYRWAGSFRATGKRRPATDEAALAVAEGPCSRLTGTTDWYVTWPSELAWTQGDRQLDCFRRTRS